MFGPFPSEKRTPSNGAATKFRLEWGWVRFIGTQTYPHGPKFCFFSDFVLFLFEHVGKCKKYTFQEEVTEI